MSRCVEPQAIPPYPRSPDVGRDKISDDRTGDLAPLPAEAWPDELAGVLADMKGAPLAVHQLLAHNPTLLSAWWPLRNHGVAGGTLGRRAGELVILRVAVHVGIFYEWASHVDRALAIGMTPNEIERVLERRLGSEWSLADRALLEAVDQLVERRAIDAELRRRLLEHFDAAQILDLIALQGIYLILAGMIGTWGLALDQDIAARLGDRVDEARFAAASERFSRTERGVLQEPQRRARPESK